ncbi:uncharacterized protein LOC120842207 [Ixodes scapularis]|uniref:uncharacterized protein LOC120842207 n=1 Tax=Ixodes scapularis TaxID=6945 RepID=UPI001A9E26CC|nr:uncharacterized protein LOC120842207 [Ixodes scapularis]
MSRIQEEYMAMKDRLKQELSNVAYVCITADCWTTFRRCYIGITVLWLLPRTLERRSAVLACRRLVERATYDILAATISEVLEEYDLQTKVTRVITDNGSNFLKAFRIFGEKSSVGEEDEEIENEGVDLSKLIDSTEEGICLPQHHRCAAHCLNLVSTVDASRASEDDAFSKAFTTVMRKCRCLWAKQGQSSVAAETVHKVCGVYLPTPVTTRWNSLYDSLEFLLTLRRNGKDLPALCRTLHLPPLNDPVDFNFIEEYCEVMKPVACALDVLQRDDQMFMGYLLPTLSVLQRRLEYAIMKGMRICAPLCQAVLEGLGKRFDHLMESRELLLASAVLPKFQLKWI